jgi:hypothetical protein
MKRKRPSPPPRDPYRAPARNDRAPYADDYDRDYGDRPSGGGPANSVKSVAKSALNYTTLAILAGVFILGIGVGIGFSSSASVDPQNVASREFIDRSAPNPELCVQYGASAISMSTRLFVTLSPFSVYVTQPEMQPGCVVRSNNIAMLEQEGYVKGNTLRDCKRRMNTFAFTGNLGSKPDIECVYQNDAAGNLFLDQTGGSKTRRDSEQF